MVDGLEGVACLGPYDGRPMTCWAAVILSIIGLSLLAGCCLLDGCKIVHAQQKKLSCGLAQAALWGIEQVGCVLLVWHVCCVGLHAARVAPTWDPEHEDVPVLQLRMAGGLETGRESLH